MTNYNELARYNLDLAQRLDLESSALYLLQHTDDHRAYKLLVTEALVKPFLVPQQMLCEVSFVIESVVQFHVLRPFIAAEPSKPDPVNYMYIYSALNSLYYATVTTKQYSLFA